MDFSALFQNFLGDPLSVIQSVVRDGIVAGIAVWFVHWLYTAPGSPKVIFADCIAKLTYGGRTRYIVRFINIGYRTLLECTRTAILSIETSDTPDHTKRHCLISLTVGGGETTPVIWGTSGRTNKYDGYCPVLKPQSFALFTRKDLFPPEITEKAEKNELTLTDIFERYGDSARIDIFISGDDPHAGRRLFVKKYSVRDIKEGRFHVHEPHNLHWYNRFLKFPWSQKKMKAALSELDQI